MTIFEGSIVNSEDLRDTILLEEIDWDHKNTNLANMECTKKIQYKRVDMVYHEKKEDKSKKRDQRINLIEEENSSVKRRSRKGCESEEGTRNVHYKKLKIV